MITICTTRRNNNKQNMQLWLLTRSNRFAILGATVFHGCMYVHIHTYVHAGKWVFRLVGRCDSSWHVCVTLIHANCVTHCGALVFAECAYVDCVDSAQYKRVPHAFAFVALTVVKQIVMYSAVCCLDYSMSAVHCLLFAVVSCEQVGSWKIRNVSMCDCQQTTSFGSIVFNPPTWSNLVSKARSKATFRFAHQQASSQLTKLRYLSQIRYRLSEHLARTRL
jgi:hypothetical protein